MEESETLCCWKQQCFALLSLLCTNRGKGGTYSLIADLELSGLMLLRCDRSMRTIAASVAISLPLLLLLLPFRCRCCFCHFAAAADSQRSLWDCSILFLLRSDDDADPSTPVVAADCGANDQCHWSGDRCCQSVPCFVAAVSLLQSASRLP